MKIVVAGLEFTITVLPRRQTLRWIRGCLRDSGAGMSVKYLLYWERDGVERYLCERALRVDWWQSIVAVAKLVRCNERRELESSCQQFQSHSLYFWSY